MTEAQDRMLLLAYTRYLFDKQNITAGRFDGLVDEFLSEDSRTYKTPGCALCHQSVNPHDPHTWKQVKGWVGGPRKDSMRLREDTGWFAHDACVAKLQAGQAIDQTSLFEEVEENGERKQHFADPPDFF